MLFPKISSFFACFSQKLAPARKNSTDWSAGRHVFATLMPMSPGASQYIRDFGLLGHNDDEEEDNDEDENDDDVDDVAMIMLMTLSFLRCVPI